MKQQIITAFGFFGLLSLAACSSTVQHEPLPGKEGQGTQELVAKGDCTFEACSSLPSSLSDTPKVVCTNANGEECAWADAEHDPNDDAVSYRPCQESECPPRPAVDCPSDTVQASQQCGDENDRGCAWTTVCVPPRETTPCPAASGCDSQPVQEIGIICKDGSTGGFACVTNDKGCYWERNCD